MGSLYASDVLWTQLASPEITGVLEEDDVEAAELPAGNFMPENDATKYLDQTEIVSLLDGRRHRRGRDGRPQRPRPGPDHGRRRHARPRRDHHGCRRLARGLGRGPEPGRER